MGLYENCLDLNSAEKVFEGKSNFSFLLEFHEVYSSWKYYSSACFIENYPTVFTFHIMAFMTTGRDILKHQHSCVAAYTPVYPAKGYRQYSFFFYL